MPRRTDLAAVEAVLLDMDGTLVDSDAAVERAWATWAEEYGVDPGAVLAIAHGSPAARTVRRPCIFPLHDGPFTRVRAAARTPPCLVRGLWRDVTRHARAAPPARHQLRPLRPAVGPLVTPAADGRLAMARLHAADIGIRPAVLLTRSTTVRRLGNPDPDGDYLRLRSTAAFRIAPSACDCAGGRTSEPGAGCGRAVGHAGVALRGSGWRPVSCPASAGVGPCSAGAVAGAAVVGRDAVGSSVPSVVRCAPTSYPW
ncbi:HAD family hydrolase [Nonomuraea rubra]